MDYFDNKEFLKEKEKFSLFYRMLNSKEKLFYTDHDSYLVGQGNKNFPVWVWTKENLSKDKLVELLKVLDENYLLQDETELVCKLELYDYLRQYYETSNYLEMGFLLCRKLNDVELVEGYVDTLKPSERDLLVKYWQDDYKEMSKGKELSLEEAYEEVDKWLSGEKTMFAYRNKDGKPVSLAGYGEDYGIAKVTHVYTPKEERCKGYCSTLVYLLTKELLEKGLTPVLYTDYSYAPSNHTYKKVGYEDQGVLVSCKVKKKA